MTIRASSSAESIVSRDISSVLLGEQDWWQCAHARSQRSVTLSMSVDERRCAEHAGAGELEP